MVWFFIAPPKMSGRYLTLLREKCRLQSLKFAKQKYKIFPVTAPLGKCMQ